MDNRLDIKKASNKEVKILDTTSADGSCGSKTKSKFLVIDSHMKEEAR